MAMLQVLLLLGLLAGLSSGDTGAWSDPDANTAGTIANLAEGGALLRTFIESKKTTENNIHVESVIRRWHLDISQLEENHKDYLISANADLTAARDQVMADKVALINRNMRLVSETTNFNNTIQTKEENIKVALSSDYPSIIFSEQQDAWNKKLMREVGKVDDGSLSTARTAMLSVEETSDAMTVRENGVTKQLEAAQARRTAEESTRTVVEAIPPAQRLLKKAKWEAIAQRRGDINDGKVKNTVLEAYVQDMQDQMVVENEDDSERTTFSAQLTAQRDTKASAAGTLEGGRLTLEQQLRQLVVKNNRLTESSYELHTQMILMKAEIASYTGLEAQTEFQRAAATSYAAKMTALYITEETSRNSLQAEMQEWDGYSARRKFQDCQSQSANLEYLNNQLTTRNAELNKHCY